MYLTPPSAYSAGCPWRPPPVAVQQTLWPGCPPSSARHVLPVYPAMAGRASAWANESPSHTESRIIFLDRALFDLVSAHQHLSLNDPKLLAWYLHLSPEDRRIIQDSGGLYQFLQGHPALELTVHHVYLSRLPPSHVDVKSLPVRREFTSFACSDSRIGSLYYPHEDTSYTEQPACEKYDFRAKSVSPTTEGESPAPDAVDDEVSLSFQHQTGKFHSIMEDDGGVLVCLASHDVKSCNREVQSGPVTTKSEALAAESETLTSDQSLTKINTAEKSTSPIPYNTCDIMVGTELVPGMSAFTQTEEPGACDKHVITEVHMADLDYLAEEFIKLKMAKEELSAQKEKMKSSGCKLRKKCSCFQRAQQAELCLLALQYSMCRQHCWRLYHSAEGGHFPPMPDDPPANIAHVLQNLESDYDQMRGNILAGVPLEQLKPLSVESEKIITRASYTPAQIIGDVLGNLPSWTHQKPEKHTGGPSVEENHPDDRSTNGCQHRLREEQTMKTTMKRAVTLVSQGRGATQSANQQEGKQTIFSWTAASCKELNTGETWYDAEEEPAGAVGAGTTGQEPTLITKQKPRESASEETKSSAVCVSSPPGNVSESAVDTHQVGESCTSALRNDLRVAMVISGPQSAEDAGRKLNYCSTQSHTLHVERISGAMDRSHESSQDATKPGTSKTDSSVTERKPLLSISNRKEVCISPTAKGTCVPQHYGTMGSFDTLMAELKQHHPDIGRQRIVDALQELKAQHQGVLSSLPLRTIREMTSELLTRPASAPGQRGSSHSTN